MQAEYVPTAVYLEFTFISTEELSFDPNQRHKARLASVLIVQGVSLWCVFRFFSPVVVSGVCSKLQPWGHLGGVIFLLT